MGHIFFAQYYMNFVEYCFRAHYHGRPRLPEKWLYFTDAWFEHLPEKDEEFLAYVFSDRYENSFEGCVDYGRQPYKDCPKHLWHRPQENNTSYNRARLFRLEYDFAVAAGITNKTGRVDLYY